MACSPGDRILYECGDGPRLIFVRHATDVYARPAWAVPVCEEGEIVSVDLFSNPEATEPLPGYGLDDEVPRPESLEQTLDPIVVSPSTGPNYSYHSATYDDDTNLTSIIRSLSGQPDQIQTYTWVGGLLIAISAWGVAP